LRRHGRVLSGKRKEKIHHGDHRDHGEEKGEDWTAENAEGAEKEKDNYAEKRR
jgi:hypothetical protein